MRDITTWRRRLLRLGAPLLLIGVALPASATKIYQYTNSAGETVFTDEPVPGAKVHEVESPPVIPMTPVEVPEPVTDGVAEPGDSGDTGHPATSGEPSSTTASAPAAEPAYYDQLAIVEPVDGEVASRPHGSITIELAIEPGLRAGDHVFVLVDGEPRVRDSTGRRHLINGLAAGSHELVAQIRREGEVLRESAVVRFSLVTSAQ